MLESLPTGSLTFANQVRISQVCIKGADSSHLVTLTLVTAVSNAIFCSLVLNFSVA